MRLIVSIVVLVAVTYLLSSGVLAARCRLAYCPADATVSCFSKIQIGFTFLVLAHPGSPGQMAVKRACVCVCVLLLLLIPAANPQAAFATRLSTVYVQEGDVCCLVPKQVEI